jgi:hypothetical protein
MDKKARLIKALQARIENNRSIMSFNAKIFTQDFERFYKQYGKSHYKATIENRIINELVVDLQTTKEEEIIRLLQRYIEYFLQNLVEIRLYENTTNLECNISGMYTKEVYQDLYKFYNNLLTDYRK